MFNLFNEGISQMQSSAIIIHQLNDHHGHSHPSSENTRHNGPTHYDILHVPETASADEIRRAYRQQLKNFRDDKNGSVTANYFQSMLTAYKILNNDAARRRYDEELVSARSFDGFLTAFDNFGKILCTAMGNIVEKRNANNMAQEKHFLLFIGVSYAIEMMGAIAAVYDPESMVGSILCGIGFLMILGTNYVVLSHFNQEKAFRDGFFKPLQELKPVMEEMLEHHKRVEATYRASVPKLTYVAE